MALDFITWGNSEGLGLEPQQAEIDLQGFTPFSQGYSGLTGPALGSIAHRRHVPGAICNGLSGQMFDNVLLSNIIRPAGATMPLADIEDTLLKS